MKKLKKKTAKKNSASRTFTESDLLQDKILAYCGYKFVGKKLVATGNYNPVPYQGL
ncbi:MAG: hypothetical protein HDR54_01975 [Treponema sp.]|nr:hypothetical protein [Treponema sp.]